MDIMRPSLAFAVPLRPSAQAARHWFRLLVVTLAGAVALAVVFGIAP